MRSHWLIQSSGLRRTDEMTQKLIRGIEAADCTWSDFGVIPFTNEITNWESIPSGVKVFVHCSTKVLDIFFGGASPQEIFPGASWEDATWRYMAMKNGLFYDKTRFDQTVYGLLNTPRGKLYADLVNGKCQVFSLHQALDERFHFDKFVKPGPDLKLFSGSVLPAGQSLRELLATQTVSSAFERCMEDRVLFAPVMNIHAEWRFFVVHGKVITGSQYRKHGVLRVSEHIPTYVSAHAQMLVNLYRPNPTAFTIDLALTEDLELQIMEYNCANCSGLYDASTQCLAWALLET